MLGAAYRGLYRGVSISMPVYWPVCVVVTCLNRVYDQIIHIADQILTHPSHIKIIINIHNKIAQIEYRCSYRIPLPSVVQNEAPPCNL